jgi:hypothetical protein
MINLKQLLKETTADRNYFNDNKFKLSKEFPAYYIKKYGSDPRFEPNDWPGKLIKIYKVKTQDKSLQITWHATYKTLGGSSPPWSIIIPIKDIIKYKLFDKV